MPRNVDNGRVEERALVEREAFGAEGRWVNARAAILGPAVGNHEQGLFGALEGYHGALVRSSVCRRRGAAWGIVAAGTGRRVVVP